MDADSLVFRFRVPAVHGVFTDQSLSLPLEQGIRHAGFADSTNERRFHWTTVCSNEVVNFIPPYGCCTLPHSSDYIFTLTGLGASRPLGLYSLRIVSTPFLSDLARYFPLGMFTVFTQFAFADYSAMTPSRCLKSDHSGLLVFL